jgi:hypothetical protein
MGTSVESVGHRDSVAIPRGAVELVRMWAWQDGDELRTVTVFPPQLEGVLSDGERRRVVGLVAKLADVVGQAVGRL